MANNHLVALGTGEWLHGADNPIAVAGLYLIPIAARLIDPISHMREVAIVPALLCQDAGEAALGL